MDKKGGKKHPNVQKEVDSFLYEIDRKKVDFFLDEKEKKKKEEKKEKTRWNLLRR
ncbi:MAG: hypothetical protein KAJ44_01280 [Thermoplasmatales archaeon]|nr:hypothetical protein [Thermoplasmatales archaeon]